MGTGQIIPLTTQGHEVGRRPSTKVTIFVLPSKEAVLGHEVPGDPMPASSVADGVGRL